MHTRSQVGAAVMSVMLVVGTFAFAGATGAEPPTVDEAHALQRSGNFAQAAEAWHAIVEDDPDNGTAWFNLGYSLHAMGDLEHAIEVHRKAASFDRFEGIASYNLGCAYALRGDADKAFAALSAASAAGFDVRASAPGDSDLESLRSDPRYAALVGATSAQDEDHRPSRSLMGGNERLRELFQVVATRMQPTIEELFPMIHERFGLLAREAMMHGQKMLQQFQERVGEDQELMSAMQEIHRTLSEDPRFSEIMQKANAWIEQQFGGGGQSSARPQEAGRESPSSQPSNGIDLATAQRLQNEGEHETAALMFGALLESDPNNPAFVFGYAYNLHMGGAHKAAIEAHKAAAEFDQIRGISLYNLGCAYALTNQPDLAIEALRASAEAGFDVGEAMTNDRDLDSLRDDERFIRLHQKLKGGR